MGAGADGAHLCPYRGAHRRGVSSGPEPTGAGTGEDDAVRAAGYSPCVGPVSVLLGALAAAALVVPEVGKYVALGVGLLAVAVGLVAFRRPRARLWGAAGVTVGLCACILAATQIGLTLVVLERLRRI